MDWFVRIPIAALAIIVGTVTAICWIAFDGTLPLVVTIAGGGVIALHSVLGSGDSDGGSSDSGG